MTGFVDDGEAEIEAEIQRELDEISEDNLEVEDLEKEEIISPYFNEKDADLPPSLEKYLTALRSRTEGVEQDVKDCDIVLNKLPIGRSDDDEQSLAKKIKEALGDGCHGNPLDIRDKVLSEIELLEQEEEKVSVRRSSNADNMAIEILRTDVSDQIQMLEEAAEKQLKELEEKQERENKKRIQLYENMKREENERMNKEQETRRKRQEEIEAAHKQLNENQQIAKEKLEKEAEQDKQQFALLQQQFQDEIKEIEEESRKEKAALEEMKIQEAEYQRNKQNTAAIKIQKIYRGHRVYCQHKEVLQKKRLERNQKFEEELEKLELMEKKEMEEMERRKKKEKENKELLEKRRIDEERKRKEEQWKEERKEQKRKEEEKRKMEQMRIEEEKRKMEQMRIEEEKRKMEQMRIEEEKRKMEQMRIEEEKRKMEQMRIEEEEKKRKEAKKRELELIEQKKKEEEKIKREEEKRREFERVEKEKQERILAEQKRKELEEIERKKKKEEEKRKMEAEKHKQEEEKQKTREKEEMERQKMKKLEEEKKRKYENVKRKSEPLKNEVQKDVGKNLTKPEERKDLHCVGLKHLEEKRLQWIKDHTPWSSTTSEDRKQPCAKTKSRQRPRRPFSASRNLPSLTEDQLVQASPPGTCLNKVIRVSVSSLPACNMHGLNHCPDLISLTIHNCGLMAVEGLEECMSIKELCVQDNCVEYVNCKDLHNLQEILLNNNSLTSVHGLDGCKELRHLDLTNNKITRLGDLSSCSKLQTLCLDKNQLIMTKGLSSLPNLQSLSCENNHLPNVKEIDTCQLLQYLNLQGNNLQKPPLLSNHVLLRELRLDDNSICTLEPLTQVWLPSLHLLSASQNSISSVESLEGLIVLQTLDIRHNLISDLESLTPGLSQCKELKVLRITGNPVNEEPQCRKEITEALEFLTKLDDETLQPKKSSSDSYSPLTKMCCNQQEEHKNMMTRHTTELSSFDDSTVDPRKVKERLKIKNKQYEETYQLAVTHVQQHERYGTNEPREPELSQDAPAAVANELHKFMTKEATSPYGIVGAPKPELSRDAPATVEKDLHKSVPEETDSPSVSKSVMDKRLSDDPSVRTAAAVKIQCVWRGWHIRHLIDIQMKKWLAAVTIQATWRGYKVRSRVRKSRVFPARKALWGVRHHAAATTIQACYRGYRVRQRVASALRAVQYYNDDDDDDDFNYDEEVDLSAFDFDSGVLDEGWTPTDTPQLPSRGPILPGAGQSFQKRAEQLDSYVPRQAWRSADSPMEQGLPANQRRVPAMHCNQKSPEQDLISVTSGTQSHSTHRAEELGNEWGVKNQTTAELMWKRANRMKYNPARKRKLLDPNKRLALFKKLDEANKLREVKPPPKRQQRVDYFAAREAAMLPSGSNTPTSERQTKAQMTYSWVHNQGVMHVDQEEQDLGFTKDYCETKDKKPTKRNPSKSISPITLPHMDPVSLTGRNVPLVSSPALIQDHLSMDSTPPARRNSSATQQIHFPPIKTYSVPNLTARSAVSQANGSYLEKSNSAGARMTKERRQRR